MPAQVNVRLAGSDTGAAAVVDNLQKALAKLIVQEQNNKLMDEAKVKLAGMTDEEKQATLAAVQLGEQEKNLGNESQNTGMRFTELNSAISLARQGIEESKKIYEATVGTFLNLADAVRLLSTTTGDSIEELSRLLAVFGKYGVEANQLQVALARAVKEGFDPTIEGVVQLANKLNGLSDNQERANEMATTFGKTWYRVNELISQGPDAIKAEMAAVNDNLVLTQQQSDAARKLEFANHDLEESWKGIATAIGSEVAPALATLAENVNLDIQRRAVSAEGMDMYHKGLITYAELYKIDALAIRDVVAAQKELDDINRIAAGEATGKHTPAIVAVSHAYDDMAAAQWDVHGSATALGDAEADLAAQTAYDTEMAKQSADATKARAAAQQAEANAIANTLSTAAGGMPSVQNKLKTLEDQIKNIPLVPLEEWATKSADNIGKGLAEGTITQADAQKAADNIQKTLQAGINANAAGKPFTVPFVMNFSKPATGTGSKGQALADAIINGTAIPDVKAMLALDAARSAEFESGFAEYMAMQNKTVTITQNIVSGSGGGGGRTWHPGYTGPDGKWHDGYWAAGGLDTIIPPGNDNDTGIVHVSSGEHVTVTPANQVKGGKAGDGIVININGITEPNEVARAVVKAIKANM